ncbi:DUF455 family protein [Altererythrobacter indicus]|uniref:DUF455 family protein n=1 Tax=Altericroceibacterium indicum TaxID=374177 RepID=A0A845A9J3_9SPHN|nr:ferritin-like domain-containing protein [Altericroceibacterium indicum]MXP26364.1 DUF455 family protein [Altericroceibacterium indicum]
MQSLGEAIRAALLTGDPRAKVMATRQLVRDWRQGRLSGALSTAMPDRPCWPDRLKLLPPSQMPRRAKGGSEKTRIALWHSLAHIEFVAIDLALDMVGRFGSEMDEEFIADFLSVAADEAMHFALIDRKLRQIGIQYGDLPAHDGLWEAAQETCHDVAARLAIVPMVLEARGLDVTPATLNRVRGQGDLGGAKILERILSDEIRHVHFGAKHFTAWCLSHDETPEILWKRLVKKHFRGSLKPPFNDSARSAAGLSRSFYEAVA